MFIVYTIPKPGLFLYLKNEDVKKVICDRHHNIIDANFIKAFSFIIKFTDDKRKACTFATRDVALYVAQFLCDLIPEDFKIEML